MHWGITKAISRGCYTAYYASTQTLKSKVGKTILLHRFLVDAPPDKVVDHIDGDDYNNRKSNLRICTNTENIRNQKLSKLNKSGHKGVYWNHELVTPKWRANIKVNKKTIHIGYYDNYEDACKAREEAEIEYFGEYSELNRPKQLEEGFH